MSIYYAENDRSRRCRGSTIPQVSNLRIQEEETPVTEDGKVSPRIRQRGSDLRCREHLAPEEPAKVTAAAGKAARLPRRDSTLRLIMYLHRLRVGVAVALR